jgi:hypothetical protein
VFVEHRADAYITTDDLVLRNKRQKTEAVSTIEGLFPSSTTISFSDLGLDGSF